MIIQLNSNSPRKKAEKPIRGVSR